VFVAHILWVVGWVGVSPLFEVCRCVWKLLSFLEAILACKWFQHNPLVFHVCTGQIWKASHVELEGADSLALVLVQAFLAEANLP